MNMKCGFRIRRQVVFQSILAFCWLVGSGIKGTSAHIRPPKDSGCLWAIKNYGCYCSEASGQRRIPNKCNELFDEELINSGSGFPAPTTVNYPNLGADLKGINMTAGTICVQDKYCEINVTPADPDWDIIDWCITTTSGELHHLQLLGPPHSPVCCDLDNDQQYTMMCMRRDMNLQRFLPSPLLISLYVKLLPRAPVHFRLSLILLNKPSVNDTIPTEFKDKKNTGGALVKLIKVEDLILDLSTIKKWEDL